MGEERIYSNDASDNGEFINWIINYSINLSLPNLMFYLNVLIFSLIFIFYITMINNRYRCIVYTDHKITMKYLLINSLFSSTFAL